MDLPVVKTVSRLICVKNGNFSSIIFLNSFEVALCCLPQAIFAKCLGTTFSRKMFLTKTFAVRILMFFFSFSVELRSSQLSLQPPSCRASRHLDHVHHHCCSQSIGCSTASRRRRRPFRPPLTIVELLIINQEEKRRRCVSK